MDMSARQTHKREIKDITDVLTEMITPPKTKKYIFFSTPLGAILKFITYLVINQIEIDTKLQ